MRRLSEHKYLCFGGLRRRRFKFVFISVFQVYLIDLRWERLRKILTSFGEKGVIESHTFEGTKSVMPSIYGEQVNIRSPVYNQSSPIRGSGANATQEINNISNNCTIEGLCGVQTGEFDLSLVLRWRILESILSQWKRSLRDDFWGFICKNIYSKLQWVIEMNFRHLYDLGRTYRATLNPWFQTYFSLHFHHRYESYRPI